MYNQFMMHGQKNIKFYYGKFGFEDKFHFCLQKSETLRS